MSSNIPKPTSGIPKPMGSSLQQPHAPAPTTLTRSAPSQAPAAKQDASKKPEQSSAQAPVEGIVHPYWTEMEAKYKRDIEILTESTEMATIEKEIAEEKLDNCEHELKELKDKLAEATLQIEMLTKEQHSNQSIGAGNSESAVTVFQLQKVEEQNELLKQALIKLRDMSANDKKALEDLQIEQEELQVKVLDLEDKEQRYLEQIKIFEEQIDVSQSAQEMVEKLTQQKTELEDKLREAIEDMDAMEQLRDFNEQLLENARLIEIDLNGELDQLRVQYSELNNRKRDMEDYLSDQERTVAKLRDENRSLNEQVARLNEQFKAGESLEQQKHQIENVAYKLNFSEVKMAEKEAEIVRYKRNLADMETQMNSLSMITKEQSARLDDLKMKHDAKVSECSELQRALKKKMEDVSELEIRRDLAEKKLQTIQRDAESRISNLMRQIEAMKGIEIQHEEDMRRLMEDNEIIERERRELRDQLNKSNRSLERSIQTATMVTAQDTSLASLGISFQSTPSSQVSPLHQTQQPSLAQQQQQHQQQQTIPQTPQAPSLGSTTGQGRIASISSEAIDSISLVKHKGLSSVFEHLNRRNYELELELAMRELNSKAPPYVRSDSNISEAYNMDKARRLRNEAQKLRREVRTAMIDQQIFTKSKHISSQTRDEKFNNSKLAARYQLLEEEANSVLTTSKLTNTRPKQMAPLLHSTPVK